MKFRFWVISVWRAGFMALCKYVLGLDYQVIGRENIPASPSVIMSKHQSAWETVSLQAIFPPLVFVLKKSLLMIPFLGWAFAAVKMISIDRRAGQDALRQVISQGRDRLKAVTGSLSSPRAHASRRDKNVASRPAARIWRSAPACTRCRSRIMRRILGTERLRQAAGADHGQHRTGDRPERQDGG